MVRTPTLVSYIQAFTNSYSLIRAVLRTMELSSKFTTYKHLIKHNISVSNATNTTLVDHWYNEKIYTELFSLNTARALDMTTKVLELTYSVSSTFTVSGLALRTSGIALDFIQPEKYLSGISGTAIHYTPELLVYPIIEPCNYAHIRKISYRGLEQSYYCNTTEYTIFLCMRTIRRKSSKDHIRHSWKQH